MPKRKNKIRMKKHELILNFLMGKCKSSRSYIKDCRFWTQEVFWKGLVIFMKFTHGTALGFYEPSWTLVPGLRKLWGWCHRPLLLLPAQSSGLPAFSLLLMQTECAMLTSKLADVCSSSLFTRPQEV